MEIGCFGTTGGYVEPIKDGLYCGDCFDFMPRIEDASVDMILCDLPYGVLKKSNPGAKWDRELPLEELWTEYRRVIKPNGAIVLFGSGMFTAKLMVSNHRMWRYNLVWCKGNRVTGFLNANRMPMRNHEDICVFYKSLPTYNPQFIKDGGMHRRGGTGKRNNLYGKVIEQTDGYNVDNVYPRSVLNFPKPARGAHPSEKPVELLKFLIKMYTNEGELVLDNTMGSGSMCVACVETGRRFIGIEKNEAFYKTACERVKEAVRDMDIKKNINLDLWYGDIQDEKKA